MRILPIALGALAALLGAAPAAGAVLQTDRSYGVRGAAAVPRANGFHVYGAAALGGTVVANLDHTLGSVGTRSLARVDARGRFDRRFGRGGFVSLSLGTRQELFPGAIVPVGGNRVIVTASVPSRGRVGVWSLDRRGHPTRGFGSRGRLTMAPPCDGVQAGATLAGTRLLLTFVCGDTLQVRSFGLDGNADPTFGAEGRLAITVAGEAIHTYRYVHGRDTFLVAGAQSDPGGTTWTYRLHSYTTDGQPDSTFGGGGVATLANRPKNSLRFTVDPASGRILVLAWDETGETTTVSELLENGVHNPLFSPAPFKLTKIFSALHTGGRWALYGTLCDTDDADPGNRQDCRGSLTLLQQSGALDGAATAHVPRNFTGLVESGSKLIALGTGKQLRAYLRRYRL